MKKCLPPPLLKHNCGLSHLSSVSLATSRPDYCHTCSQSRNHLNRTCLTKWSRPKDPQKLHIMLTSKEIQEQMRKKVIEIYQSGKGYKAISKALGLQRTTVRAIIHKWRKHGTVVNLPRSGRPTKITPRAQQRLIQEVTKDPTTTSKELQASLASVKVSVHDSTIRKRLGKNGLHGRVPRPKPLLSKKNIKAHLSFARKHLDDPQDFWENTLWTDETKVELFGRCVSHYIWRKSNTAFQKKNIIPTVKYGGGSVMVWGWKTCCDKWNHEFCCLPKNPEGQCPAICSWPQAEANLGSAAGQWSKTHQQIHLWMAEEKQNEDFGVA